MIPCGPSLALWTLTAGVGRPAPIRFVRSRADRIFAEHNGRQFEIFRLEGDSPDFRGSNLLRAMLRPLRP
jgi:hypothetical protein